MCEVSPPRFTYNSAIAATRQHAHRVSLPHCRHPFCKIIHAAPRMHAHISPLSRPHLFQSQTSVPPSPFAVPSRAAAVAASIFIRT